MPSPTQLLNERLRLFGIIKEIDIAVSMLTSGLAVMQSSRLYNTKHFVFLLLLSNGLERLMKVILILRKLHVENRFLSKTELRNLGHNLKGLCEQIADNCFTSEYHLPPIGVADQDFLKHDPLLQKVLALLSDFAIDGRYAYLNAAAHPEGMNDTPDQRWGDLEISQIPIAEWISLFESKQDDTLKKRMMQDLIVCLEKLIRALTRLFLYHALGDIGRQNSAAVWDFARVEDAALGTRQYEM